MQAQFTTFATNGHSASPSLRELDKRIAAETSRFADEKARQARRSALYLQTRAASLLDALTAVAAARGAEEAVAGDLRQLADLDRWLAEAERQFWSHLYEVSR